MELVGLLLEKEPHNMQAESLAGLIDSKMTRGAFLQTNTPLLHLLYDLPFTHRISSLISCRGIHRPRTRRWRSSSRHAPPRESHPASKPPLISTFFPISSHLILLCFFFALECTCHISYTHACNSPARNIFNTSVTSYTRLPTSFLLTTFCGSN